MKVASIIPVFHVVDVDASTRYYTEILGFSVTFRLGTYVGLKIGSQEIHISPPGDYQKTVGGGTAYVICDEVDTYYSQLKATGATICSDLADRNYRFRDFAVLDWDGNQIIFGRDIE